MDIHAAKPDLASYERYAEDFKKLRYGKGESYGIPYRCLVPRKLTNVLVAGRCVSTDRYMQSSIRVMPGCFITGQAIGVAAAICAKQGCDTRGVPVAELQRRLKAIWGPTCPIYRRVGLAALDPPCYVAAAIGPHSPALVLSVQWQAK